MRLAVSGVSVISLRVMSRQQSGLCDCEVPIVWDGRHVVGKCREGDESVTAGEWWEGAWRWESGGRVVKE